MEETKKLGIWMDHANAHIMEFTHDPIRTKTIASKFTHEAKAQSRERGENVMNHREQHQQTEYYKGLGEVIRNYDEVLLFGPTEAKDELFNVLKADHNLKKVKIETKHSDRMTENQQHAFVREYFLGC
ncbi:MAG TPA: hypothetical protein VF411_09075 [Bacteroidia bacterium]